MSCASAGLALPANSASVSLVRHIMRSARPTPSHRRALRRRPQSMAGVEGFEPPNGGIKTRCLTTWRHPSIRTARAETVRGRASYSRINRAARAQALVHGEVFSPRATKLRPASGTCAARRSASMAVAQRGEHAGPGSGQPRRRHIAPANRAPRRPRDSAPAPPARSRCGRPTQKRRVL